MNNYFVTIWFKDDPEPYSGPVCAADAPQAYGLALIDARMGDSRGRVSTGDVIKSSVISGASNA